MSGKIFIKLGVFLIALGLCIQSVDITSAYIEDFNKDVELSDRISEDVDKNYAAFNSKVGLFKYDLESAYESFDGIYLSTFPNKKSDILAKIDIINNDITKLDNNKKELDKLCSYGILRDNVKSKCDTYIINYNTVINSKNKIYEEYNKIVIQYNDYALLHNLKKETIIK